MMMTFLLSSVLQLFSDVLKYLPYSMATSEAAAAEPEELQGEPRWSSIRYAPHPRPVQWSRITDEKLMLLVTQSTASGERFPVGVNCA